MTTNDVSGSTIALPIIVVGAIFPFSNCSATARTEGSDQEEHTDEPKPGVVATNQEVGRRTPQLRAGLAVRANSSIKARGSPFCQSTASEGLGSNRAVLARNHDR